MADFEIKEIASHDPKQKFECARCDREGMVKTKGIKRRFEVGLEVPGGNVEKFCIVCASILTGKRQGDLMRAAREKAREVSLR
jgi:hypothetical protein